MDLTEKSHATASLRQSVIWLALYHLVTTSSWHRVTTSSRHRVTTSVSHLPCPLLPNQSVICLAPCHQTSQSFDLPSTTTSLHHHDTTSPCQSDIFLAPCHQTSQSFALSPATKPVSHLPCPLPPNQSVIWLALYHCITGSPCHRSTMAPCHVSPHQSVICLAPCYQTNQSFDLPSTTTSPHHCVIVALQHHSTASPHEIFPTTWVWIWLVNTTQHSSDWLISPTTANQITGIEKPNYHKTLIFFPTTSLKRSHEARIDELADSNEPANINLAANMSGSIYGPLPFS